MSEMICLPHALVLSTASKFISLKGITANKTNSSFLVVISAKFVAVRTRIKLLATAQIFEIDVAPTVKDSTRIFSQTAQNSKILDLVY
ncbi:hypothetical protein ACOME3_003021 [Neoechinorhynchus agilis]